MGCRGPLRITGGSGGPYQFSCTGCSVAPQGAWFPEGWQAESRGGAQVYPIPGVRVRIRVRVRVSVRVTVSVRVRVGVRVRVR